MKYTSKLGIVAAATFMMAACSNKDLYDPQQEEQIKKEEFSQNFIKHFGQIPANQSWDFADSPMVELVGTSGKVKSRAAGTTKITCTPDAKYAYLNADGYFDIPATMQTSLNKLQENVDNSKAGNTYAMSVPDNNFTIIPIRQGYTSSTYEIHMVVGSGDEAVDYLLWKKGELMQTRKAGTTNKWANVTNAEKSYTYGNFDVRSKVITFTNMPENAPMYFYVYRPTTGFFPSSLEGYMKDYTDIVDLPEQLVNDGKHVKVIGVEAQRDAAYVDYDYEDIMFMIVGDPTLPEEIEKEDLSFKQTVNKRYMIEDLGETDDTDYNDVVIDLTTSRTITFEYNDATGEILNRTYGPWEKQTATIRHKGGVLDFNLRIGDTELGWMRGEMNVSPNTVHSVSGWDPNANNISVTVKQRSDGEGVSSITFPAAGSVPLIIATSINQPWMEERESFIPFLKDIIANQSVE